MSSSISTLIFGGALGSRSALTLPRRICLVLLRDELFVDFLQDALGVSHPIVTNRFIHVLNALAVHFEISEERLDLSG